MSEQIYINLNMVNPDENFTDEIWKTIPDTNDKREVSDLGRVKTCLKNGKEKITYGSKHDDGYRHVSINGKRRYIHALVMEAFKPEGRKETVNHKDGIKHNNKLSNLEWATHIEQMAHANKNNLISKDNIKSIKTIGRKNKNYKGDIQVFLNKNHILTLFGKKDQILKGFNPKIIRKCIANNLPYPIGKHQGVTFKIIENTKYDKNYFNSTEYLIEYINFHEDITKLLLQGCSYLKVRETLGCAKHKVKKVSHALIKLGILEKNKFQRLSDFN